MSQTAITQLVNLAKEDLPDDCSIEQLITWFSNFLSDTGSEDTLMQLESSLIGMSK
jgi:hypothetical protein